MGSVAHEVYTATVGKYIKSNCSSEIRWYRLLLFLLFKRDLHSYHLTETHTPHREICMKTTAVKQQ